MTTQTKHWGEIKENDDVEIETTDGKMEKPKLNLHKFDLPPLHQPVSIQKTAKKESLKRNWMKAPLDSKGQSYLMHSLELQHYKRRMKHMLSAAQSQQAEIQKGNVPEAQVLPSPPPAPKRFCSSEGKLLFQSKPTFLGVDYTVPSKKRGSEFKHFHNSINLDSVSVRQLMLKAVAAICSHSGFESASESSLQTITDVAVDYTTRFCIKLKTYLEHQANDETPIDGFGHVYQQFCSRDLTALQDYWNIRVKNYALKLEKEDRKLLEDYNALKVYTGSH